MSTIWTWFLANWHTLLLGGMGAMVVGWAAKWLDGKGSVFVREELEKIKSRLNENSVLSQISADDALINILEDTIPVVLHDFDDTVHQTLAQGNLGLIDWKDFGIRVWNECKAHVIGGTNDYLKNSSFSDGEKLAAIIAKRFFVTQKMSSKGLIVDNARAEMTDKVVTTTKVTDTTKSTPPVTIASEETHTEVTPKADRGV